MPEDQQGKRSSYLYHAQDFPQSLLLQYPSGTILEINAGSNPAAIQLATMHHEHLVVAQDIVPPQKKELARFAKRQGSENGPPDNFAYMVGDPDASPIRYASALFSLFPSNLEETMQWLPERIACMLQTLPDMYTAVFTEQTHGKVGTGQPYELYRKLPVALQEFGIKATTTTLQMADVARIFGETNTARYLQRYGQKVSLIEVNGQRRNEFIIDL